MQFVKEYKPIDLLLQKQIKNFVDQSNKPFEPSKIYRSDTDEKLVNTETRLSEFRLFIEKDLFSLCEQLINKISEQDKDMSYMLVKNDITHIKYNKNGYFKAHEDYLSLTTNIIEEYTLIICLRGDCIGGETILHFNDHFSYPSKATVTTDHLLLFRKDLKHEGALVQDGTKEILTMNLWGFPKKESDAIVIISFTNDTRTHVIPIHRIMNNIDNILKAYIHFTSHNITKNMNYHITDYKWEEFGIIAQIYNGQAIPYEQYYVYQHIIDYYGFNWKDLLIKNFHNNDIIEICIKPTNDDILICESISRYEEKLQNIKDFKLPYIPFKILFAEGAMNFSDDNTSALYISMSPVWASFSERNNIMFYNHMLATDVSNINSNGLYITKPFDNLIENLDKFTEADDLALINVGEDYEDEDDQINIYVPYCTNGSCIKIGLSCCIEKADPKLIIEKIFDENYFLTTLQKSGTINGTPYDYYLLDDYNNLVIDPNHFNAIYQRVESLQLYKTIKSMLKTNKFLLPQITHNVEHYFCNEQIYGNFTFLMVYGFMKMS
jgi:hypothetical protein